MIFYYEYENGKFDKVNVITFGGNKNAYIKSVDENNIITDIKIQDFEVLFFENNMSILGLKHIGGKNYEMNGYYLHSRKPKVGK